MQKEVNYDRGNTLKNMLVLIWKSFAEHAWEYKLKEILFLYYYCTKNFLISEQQNVSSMVNTIPSWFQVFSIYLPKELMTCT